jgi:hypothetical protein
MVSIDVIVVITSEMNVVEINSGVKTNDIDADVAKVAVVVKVSDVVNVFVIRTVFIV